MDPQARQTPATEGHVAEMSESVLIGSARELVERAVTVAGDAELDPRRATSARTADEEVLQLDLVREYTDLDLVAEPAEGAGDRVRVRRVERNDFVELVLRVDVVLRSAEQKVRPPLRQMRRVGRGRLVRGRIGQGLIVRRHKRGKGERGEQAEHGTEALRSDGPCPCGGQEYWQVGWQKQILSELACCLDDIPVIS